VNLIKVIGSLLKVNPFMSVLPFLTKGKKLGYGLFYDIHLNRLN
jgi:hypothetical protein